MPSYVDPGMSATGTDYVFKGLLSGCKKLLPFFASLVLDNDMANSFLVAL